MILKAIHNLLAEDASVSADVGNRIMPAGMDQDVGLPYITFQRITTTPTESLSGSEGLARAVVQINVRASTYAKAADIAESIRLATQGFSGTIDEQITIDRIHLDDMRDEPTAPTDAAGRFLPGVQIDLGVWYLHQIPQFNRS